MGIFIAWVALSLIAGGIASNKGRSFIAYTALAMALSPLVGLIAAFAAKPNTEALRNRELKTGTTKVCPDCGEVIRAEARICRYCRSEQPAVIPPAAEEPAAPKKAWVETRGNKPIWEA